jgi:hypothetical protein
MCTVVLWLEICLLLREGERPQGRAGQGGAGRGRAGRVSRVRSGQGRAGNPENTHTHTQKKKTNCPQSGLTMVKTALAGQPSMPPTMPRGTKMRRRLR